MSKATRRKWRKQQEREGRERAHQAEVVKRQRLRGFKPATQGDMLNEVNRRRRTP